MVSRSQCGSKHRAVVTARSEESPAWALANGSLPPIAKPLIWQEKGGFVYPHNHPPTLKNTHWIHWIALYPQQSPSMPRLDIVSRAIATPELPGLEN